MNYLKTALFILLLPTTVHSQHRSETYKNVEAGIGVGALSSNYLFDGYSPGYPLGLSRKVYVNHRYSGTYSLYFKYFFSKRFSIKIAAAYENESGDWQKNYDPDRYAYRKMVIGTFRRQVFTLAPEISLYYTNNNRIRTYCSFGIGLAYRNEITTYSQDYYNQNYKNGINTLGESMELDNSNVKGNGYFSPFGISVGNKICWYAEVGIGYKGVLNAGVSIRL